MREIPEVRLSAGKTETKNALQLAVQVFSHAGSDRARIEKASQWYRDPSFDHSNLVLAVAGKRVVGVVRLVPRVIHRGLEQFKAAGISSVCVDPEYRGRGLSILLMERALGIARERGFDLSFLIARRALDHYYVRFGFAGVSSYERISAAVSAADEAKKDVEFRPLKSDLIDFCLAAYDREYSACFGRVTRSREQWFAIIRSLRARGLTAASIWCQGQPVGYVIRQDSTICEVAMTNEWSLPDLVTTLAASQIMKASDDWIQIPSAHAIVRRSVRHDIRILRRSCPYGGHMVKVLNPEAMLERERVQKQAVVLPEGSDLVSVHNRTAFLLGSWTPEGDAGSLPFNIGAVDEV